MSAQLAEQGAALGSVNHLTNRFSAHLALASGVTVSIHALTMRDLGDVVAKLQPTEPANDAQAPGNVKPAPKAATAPAGTPAPAPAASSAPAAAAAAAGEAGNGGKADTTSGSAGAETASSNAAGESSAITFDELKKAFLALSQKANGRALCEGVLKPFSLAKLSEAKPEQYATVLAAIQKAAG